MLFQELLNDERAEGRAEGLAEGLAEAIVELLSELGAVSKELHEQIFAEKRVEVLSAWIKLAANSKSMEQFLKDM